MDKGSRPRKRNPKRDAALKEWNRLLGVVLDEIREETVVERESGKKSKMTQEEFARKMGWHLSKVTKQKNGEIMLRAAEILWAAEILQVSPYEIIYRVQHHRMPPEFLLKIIIEMQRKGL